MRNFLNIFKTPGFLGVLTAQFTGAFNDNLLRTAFAAFTVYTIAGLSGRDETYFLSISIAAYMLPYFLFAGIAGELADKYAKDKVISIVKLTEIFVILFAAAGFYFKSPAFLLFVLFAMGAQGAFFSPVKYSILPQMMEKNKLIPANAVMEAGRYLAVLCGVLLGMVSPGLSVNTCAIIMIIAAACGYAATFMLKDTQPMAGSLKIHSNIFKSTGRNLLLVWRSERAFWCVMGISWFWVLGAVILSLLPYLSNDTLNASSRVFNYLVALFAVGVGGGALAASKLLKGDITIKYIPISAVLMSCALLDLSYALLNVPYSGMRFVSFFTTLGGIRISLDLLIISLCAGFYIVPLNAMLQTLGAARMRSRLIAASNFINAFFMIVASAVVLAMLHYSFGAPLVVGLLALCNLVAAVHILRLLPDYVLRSGLFFLLHTLYKIKVKGLENYQNAPRRTVIIANNNSFLDPLLLAAFLPDDLTFVVDSTIAKRFWVRKFLRFINHIAIDHANPMAVKTIIEEIKKGRRIVLYPEGRISTTGSIMKIYPGPAMIVDRSGANILPICMQGTQYSRFAYFGRKLRHRPSAPFTINIMPSRKLNFDGSLKGRQRRYSSEDKVYDLMTEMKFKSSNYRQTVFRALIEAADYAGRGSRALEDIQRSPLTFGKTILASFLIGRKLARHVEPGKNIGVMLPTSNACALAFLGLNAYGRVPAMINFSSGVKNILSACRAADLKTVITAHIVVAKGGEIVAQILAGMQEAGIKIVYMEDEAKSATIIDKLRAVAQSIFAYRAERATNPRRDPDAPAVILFTSGSEGAPKGVALSHTNINANRLQLNSIVYFGLQDKFFDALPMFHSFGLVVGFCFPLLSGASVFLYPTPLHYKIIPELVYDRNANIFFGTDTFFAAYGKAAHPYDFHNVRMVGVGAEKLKDETFKLWSEKFGIRLLEAYGATEMAPGISFTTPMHFKRGTVGRIFPGLDYKLEPVPGVEAGGKLVLSGPNVMLGYLTEAVPGVIVPPANGWYDTGDIVNMDEEGYISIVGRAKRFAKIAGEMVSMGAVEVAVAKIWPQAAHGVIRLPDEKRGEQLYLYTTAEGADIKQIQDAFRQQGLPDLWVPKTVEVLSEMPIMGSGKVDYVKLQERERSI